MLARRLSLAASLAALVACLTACSDSDDGPSTLPSLDSTSTSGSSPTEPSEGASASASAFDESARASAEQFIRAWWADVDEALAGRGALPTTSFLPSCSYCAEIDQTVARNAEVGQRTEGGGRTVESVAMVGAATNVEGALFENVLDVAPGSIVDDEGLLVRSFSGGEDIRYIFNLLRSGDGWIIQDLIPQGPS